MLFYFRNIKWFLEIIQEKAAKFVIPGHGSEKVSRFRWELPVTFKEMLNYSYVLAYFERVNILRYSI